MQQLVPELLEALDAESDGTMTARQRHPEVNGLLAGNDELALALAAVPSQPRLLPWPPGTVQHDAVVVHAGP